MRHWLSVSGWLPAALAVLAGCFNPSTEGVTFSCTLEDPACPPAHRCEAGICRPHLPDLSTAGDAAVSSDGPTPDLAQPGCANGKGVQVGAGWACPGTFPKGAADSLCATGFSPCKTPAGLDLPACNQLPSFFVVDVLAFSQFPECRNVDPPLFTCAGFQTGFDNRLRFGCGGLNKPYVLTSCQRTCAGFDRALNCSREVDYLCGSSLSLADETNLIPSIGTLCCPG